MTRGDVEPRLEILPAGDRWTWRFVESDVTLDGNLMFAGPEEAEASARRSYPDVRDVRVADRPAPVTEASDTHDHLLDVGRVLGGIAALVVLWAILRRLGER